MKKTISVLLYTAAVVLVVCGVSCKSAQNAQQKSPVESMPSEPSVQEAEQTPMNTAAAHESTAPNTMTGAASDTLADPLHTAEANTASMNEPVTEQNIAEQQNSGDTADVKTADAEPSVELVPHAQPAESTAASPAQQTDNTAVQPSAVQPANTPSARTAQTGAASGSHNVPTKPDARQQANQSLPKNRQSSAAATAATSPAQSSSRSSPATTAPAERRSAQAGAPQTNRSASSRTENGAGSAAAKAAANASSQLAQQDAQKSTQSESADGKADEGGPVSEQNEPVIIPSRSVSAKINQFIDIVYPGKGWIYLGEVKAVKPPVISFSKRVRDNENTLFSLQAKRAGTTLLHFYKQDPLAASYLDDYVEVNVLNERGTARDHIRLEAHPLPDTTSVQPSENNENANGQSAQAGSSGQNGTPSAANTTSGAEAIAGGNGTAASGINGSAAGAGTTGKGSQNKNAGETETAIEAVLDADALFEKAQTAYNEKRYADALQALDEYFKIAEKNIDRALFLQGKIYESNSEFKNIRKALAVYEKLSAAFPESDLWESARKRVIYIKRFYLDIR